MIIKISSKNPKMDVIKKAASILKNGGVIVYPTDTCYGLGVNALNENAIKKMYEIKGRDYKKPTHVVVRDWQMIEELTFTNSLAKQLFEKFLPGPLTLVLNKKPHVPDILTGGFSTLGVRIPNNNVTLELSKLVNFPYTTPSANREKEPSPYSLDELKKVIDIDKIDLILDVGKLPQNLPSTMVDITSGEIKVLREGGVKREYLNENYLHG